MSSVRVAPAERVLTRLYFDYVEPIEIALKKPARMAKFGIEDPHEIRCGEVDLAPATRECVLACTEIVEAHRLYLSKYLILGCGMQPWRAVPLVIDLDRYADFDSYTECLKRRWKEVKKARQQGFYCKRFDRAVYCLDLFDIETSMRFRSGRPVLGAF